MSRVLVFGEILWDIYGDEKKIGGAPFNFAAHLASLGQSVDMVSALGDDELGREALLQLKRRSVGSEYVATLPCKTGYCSVTTGDDGKPRYDLVKGVAYDYIPCPQISRQYDALYYGSLAMRSEESAKTLGKLLEKEYKTVFYDINVRQPHFKKETAIPLIAMADILKLSREEAHEISDTQSGEELCRSLIRKYSKLRAVIMTLDKDGAMLQTRDGSVIYAPKPKSKAISTVGAGDSFSAAFMSGVLEGNSNEVCLAKATLLSDYVVTQIGAVPDLPKEILYELKK